MNPLFLYFLQKKELQLLLNLVSSLILHNASKYKRILLNVNKIDSFHTGTILGAGIRSLITSGTVSLVLFVR
ncbi:hypothetical protein PFBG_04236 [Plasmodium falciparum 7G8]|uniref:Uncharacterized protein n=1 Tax=Plasmodium falciparum (isolate 7G8) TaxID=57266 RepID=W7FHT3_PLAF8|nr:hypothetical protein PFBG_04236 [Plasmodium falciparum 7G8]